MMFVLFIPLVAILAWLAFGVLKPTLAATPARVVRDPIEILNLRYANSEITKKEYDRLKKSLQ